MPHVEVEVSFGSLVLNRDTLVRLDGEMQSAPNPNAKGDRTKADNCPQTTRTKVTAHCC